MGKQGNSPLRRLTSKALEKLSVFAFDRVTARFNVDDVGLAERRGERIGLLAYRLDKKHRTRTIANLEIAFPEWSAEQREATAKGVFQHWGRVGGDFFRTPKRTPQETLAGMEIEDPDFFAEMEALAAGRGILACTAHLGNFERFGNWSVVTGRPITVVARAANQGAIEARVAQFREHSGIKYLTRGDSARAILSCLRKNEMVGLLPDQNTSECFVPFFGKPCGTVLGPAVLGVRTGALLIPAFCVRIGVGKYKMILLPPLRTEGREKEPEAVMADYNLALESVIRRYPDQYLWMHDRWKSARRRGLL